MALTSSTKFCTESNSVKLDLTNLERCQRQMCEIVIGIPLYDDSIKNGSEKNIH